MCFFCVHLFVRFAISVTHLLIIIKIQGNVTSINVEVFATVERKLLHLTSETKESEYKTAKLTKHLY